MNLPKGSLIS
jgi:hypothetical protein